MVAVCLAKGLRSGHQQPEAWGWQEREEGLASSRGQHCLPAALATPSVVPALVTEEEFYQGLQDTPFVCFPTSWLTSDEATILREN